LPPRQAPLCPHPDHLWVIANDWVMANDLDDLDETRGDPQPAKAAGWSSSTSGTRPSCRDPGCSKGAPAWPARPGRRCCICCEGAAGRQTVAMRPRRSRAAPLTRSAFAGFCFPSDVIVLAVRWYLRFGLSYRDVEELLADRGVESTTPPSTAGSNGSRRCWSMPPGHAATPSATAGKPMRATQRSPVGGATSTVRSTSSAKSSTCSSPLSATPRQPRRFLERAIGTTKLTPVEVVTDKAATYPIALDELLPAAWHRTDRGTVASSDQRLRWPPLGHLRASRWSS
jgi:hypothetical protein